MAFSFLPLFQELWNEKPSTVKWSWILQLTFLVFRTSFSNQMLKWMKKNSRWFLVGKLVWILSSFINRACLFTVCFGALKIEIRSESARLSFSLSTFGLPHPIDIYFLYIRAIFRGKKRFFSVQLQTALPTIYVCQTGKRGTAALDWRCENMQKFAVTAKLKVEMLSPAVFTLLPTLNFSFFASFFFFFFFPLIHRLVHCSWKQGI